MGEHSHLLRGIRGMIACEMCVIVVMWDIDNVIRVAGLLREVRGSNDATGNVNEVFFCFDFDFVCGMWNVGVWLHTGIASSKKSYRRIEKTKTGEWVWWCIVVVEFFVSCYIVVILGWLWMEYECCDARKEGDTELSMKDKIPSGFRCFFVWN